MSFYNVVMLQDSWEGGGFDSTMYIHHGGQGNTKEQHTTEREREREDTREEDTREEGKREEGKRR